MNTINKYQICYPCGGGGNHLRWLLFLDDSMNYNLLPDIKSKLDFIKSEIYPKKRTCFNWFLYEGKYNNIIGPTNTYASHDIYGWEQDPTWEDKSILFMNYPSPDGPFQHSFHIFISSQPEFGMFEHHSAALENITMWLNELTLIKNSNRLSSTKKIIDASSIFEATLSETMYSEMVEYFGFANNYKEANLVHQWYYNCRINAAKEFYNYFTSNHFYNYLSIMKELGNKNMLS